MEIETIQKIHLKQKQEKGQQCQKGGTGKTTATYEVPELKKVSDVKKTANVYAVSDGQNNTIPIPKDFYYVGGNINSGIVISDNKEDEKKYANSETGDVGKELQGNQFVWIPCNIENYHKIDWGLEKVRWDRKTGILEKEQIKKYGGFYIGRYEAGVSVLDKETGTFVDSVTFGENNLKESVTAIKDNHNWGWQNTDYQARSSGVTALAGSENKANGNIVVKADSIPYYHADYYTAKEMSERLYNNKSSVYSGLVTGTQWDMMLKYMQDNGVAVKGAGCNWGNYDNVSIDEITGYYANVDYIDGSTDGFKNGSEFKTDSSTGTCALLTTGASEKVKKMNLYDVAGNLSEWTDEVAYNGVVDYAETYWNTFISRGGGLYHTYTSNQVCWRMSYAGVCAESSLGFRPVLYIK